MELGMSYPTLCRHRMQCFLAFRYSPIIPLRRSPYVNSRSRLCLYRACLLPPSLPLMVSGDRLAQKKSEFSRRDLRVAT